VAVFKAITIDNTKTIESIYWLHPDGTRTLHTQKEFLDMFNVEKEEDLVFYEALMDDIDLILPSRDEIFNTFLFNSTSGIS
jgi:hypothetical protein